MKLFLEKLRIVLLLYSGKGEEENSESDHDGCNTSPSFGTNLDAGNGSDISSSEELTGSESPSK